MQITLSESLLGFSRVLIKHLDGRGIRVTSEKGKMIKPGDTIIVKGEGMPQYKNPLNKGDLYVAFEIEYPTTEWLTSVDKKVCIHSKRPTDSTNMISNRLSKGSCRQKSLSSIPARI